LSSTPHEPIPDVLSALNHGQPEPLRWSNEGVWYFGTSAIRRFRLANGLRLILWVDDSAGVFSYQSWFGVGSSHEAPGKTGISHLFEHLMFKATKHRAEGEFDRIMEAMGAETNASTWVDWTFYREKLPAGNLQAAVALEADRMEHLLLNTSQLEREREVVKNERRLCVDNDPQGTMYERMYSLVFGKHPYGWPTIGWMEDIEALSLEDCLEFYGRYYAPNNASIVVVGDVDTSEVLSLIREHYGHMKAREIPPIVIETPPPSGPNAQTITLNVSTARMVYGWHAPPGGTRENTALEIFDVILTGGASARLTRRLVTELEYASSLGGWVTPWKLAGLYEIVLVAQPDRPLADLEKVLSEELETVLRDGISEEELEKAKNGMEASLLRQMGDTEFRAQGLGDAQTTHGDISYFLNHIQNFQDITADDVLKAARSTLRPENRTILYVQPDSHPQGAS